MKCPVCTTDLSHTELKRSGLLGAEDCDQCGGFWVSEEELHRLEPDLWSNIESIGLETAEALSNLLCPTCATQCASVFLSGHPDLRVERCPGCHGLWLDRGELKTLYEAAVEYGEARGTLEHRPDGWSAMHWVIYRLGEDWLQRHKDSWVD